MASKKEKKEVFVKTLVYESSIGGGKLKPGGGTLPRFATGYEWQIMPDLILMIDMIIHSKALSAVGDTIQTLVG